MQCFQDGPSSRFSGTGVVLGIQVVLQDEDGGDLVDDLFAGVGRAFCGIQEAMGLGGAEALIP
jgi:hypothetical protein